ncbi:MAG: FAD-dependent 5-carboxymethylaminomethyl-2-thiouridine(34) oxidoreductase MnmC [Phycisphaerae bacterium]
MSKNSREPQADIEWREGQPYSKTYQDIYNPVEDGVACASHVFLAQSNFPDRWRTARSFVIAELGFGMAVNFLLTATRWHEASLHRAVLSYVAFEKHPLSRTQLEEALAAWPLGDLRCELIRRYPRDPIESCRLVFPDHRVVLTIHVGDALDRLRYCSFKAHAWYLDGFSPTHNPAMWGEDLFHEVAAHTYPGGTVATYSAAGSVRRSLESAGFNVRRNAGFGRKAHSLSGTLDAPNDGQSMPSHKQCERAAVVGAGIAGTSVARALALRGIKVDLLDRGPTIAGGASGVHAALLHPHPDARNSVRSRFLRSGFDFVMQQRVGMDSLRTGDSLEFWNDLGVVQFPVNKRISRLKAMLTEQHDRRDLPQLIGAEEVTERCGLPCLSEGVYYDQGAFVHPPAFCRAQLAENLPMYVDGVRRQMNCDVADIRRGDHSWHVFDRNQKLISEADVVVLAGAMGALQFDQLFGLPLVGVVGHSSLIDAGRIADQLRCAVYLGAYVGPTGFDPYWVAGGGSNFKEQLEDADPEPLLAAIRQMGTWFPTIGDEDLSITEIRPGVRATTPDALPYIGALRPKLPAFDGAADSLFTAVGFGSLGMLAAPIGGEILASTIAGEPQPVLDDIVRAILPQRVDGTR